MNRIVAVLLFSCFAGAAAGADSPVAVTRYREQDLIPVKTKVRFTTLIVLPPGEEISEVSCGDTSYWVIDGRDNVLHVKPAKEGVVTNLNIVLKSKAVYSFFLEEVGAKGTPDLKVVVGEDEVLKLREDKAALQMKINELTLAYSEQKARAEQERKENDAEKAALAQLEKEIPSRLATYLTKQKFDYLCISKTEICVAAIFTTEANTYVIGRLGASPVFSGTDQKGQYQTTISFERDGNVYKLAQTLQGGSVQYLGKSFYFATR